MNARSRKIDRLPGADDGPLRRALGWIGLLLIIASLAWWQFLPRAPLPPSADAGGRVPGGPVQRVVIDAGHGGIDSGAIQAGVLEKELTLDVARRLDLLIRAEGLAVTLTRKGDETVSLAERVERANEEDESVFVSIHFDEGVRAAASGIQTFYAVAQAAPPNPASWLPLFQKVVNAPSPSLESQSLAGFIQAALVKQTEAIDRGTRAEQFFVVANVHHPAVLVEGGFLSNAEDRARITNADYRQRLAEAIRDGIMRYREVAGKTHATVASIPES